MIGVSQYGTSTGKYLSRALTCGYSMGGATIDVCRTILSLDKNFGSVHMNELVHWRFIREEKAFQLSPRPLDAIKQLAYNSRKVFIHVYVSHIISDYPPVLNHTFCR